MGNQKQFETLDAVHKASRGKQKGRHGSLDGIYVILLKSVSMQNQRTINTTKTHSQIGYSKHCWMQAA